MHNCLSYRTQQAVISWNKPRLATFRTEIQEPKVYNTIIDPFVTSRTYMSHLQRVFSRQLG